jgi:hypothetical protein
MPGKTVYGPLYRKAANATKKDLAGFVPAENLPGLFK